MSTQTEFQCDIEMYSNGMEHLTDELTKLDLIITRRLIEFRATLENHNHQPEHHHVFISQEEIDWLLQESINNDISQQQIEELDKKISIKQENITATICKSEEHRIELPLVQLSRMFNFSEFEFQALIIILAPELRHKYDRIFSYLQDDITRKKPSVDLILQLLCRSETERWQQQLLFTKNAVLLQSDIIQLTDDAQSPSGCSSLSQFLKIDSGILNFILGNYSLDSRLSDIAQLHYFNEVSNTLIIDKTISNRISSLIKWRLSADEDISQNLVLHIHGPDGIGKKALVLQQCRELQCNLLCLNAIRLSSSGCDITATLKLAFREAMILQAPLYIESIDTLFKDENKAKAFIKTLNKLINEFGWLSFFSSEKPWKYKNCFDSVFFKSIKIPHLNYLLREQVWIKTLELENECIDKDVITKLASQFKLTPRQIQSAVDEIKFENNLHHKVSNDINGNLILECRKQSNHRLQELAVKIDVRYSWKDLILPERAQILLKQICEQVSQQYKVFTLWGFDKKLSYGKGLSALFSGPPGTGKTMAAQVIANEINLDLYKIDLSTVISKYIGETEKNLSKIFEEAEASNAILFFDEADALFGKRTEVNDAHDRYANIEVSYLLQKMEEHSGIVILASNYRVNMDDAFLRRIRFNIEFPFPNEDSRLQIWKVHFPDEAPVSTDIDYSCLAKQFSLPGGNIKNVILNAAFSAATRDTEICMTHLLDSTKHEYEKIGKLWNESLISQQLTKQGMR